MNNLIKRCCGILRKHRSQWISAVLMLLISVGPVAASRLFQVQPADIPVKTVEEDTIILPPVPETIPEQPSSEAVEEVWQPDITQLNLAHFFSEGANTEDPSQSLAGEVFQELMTQDQEWSSSIYGCSDISPENMAAQLGLPRETVTGKYNPNDEHHNPEDPSTWTINSFKDIRMTVTDGDGRSISPYSNVLEIMSMANVYTYYYGADNVSLFLSYARQLWEASHSYQLNISDIYYCSGCISEDDQKRELEQLRAEALAEEGIDVSEASSSSEENTASETASPSSAVIEVGKFRAAQKSAATASNSFSFMEEASPSNASVYEISSLQKETDQENSEFTVCPGHVDLIIHMKIHGLSEQNSLFSIDSFQETNALADSLGEDSSGWKGWTDTNKAAAIALSQQDWFEKYGLTVSGISTGVPLTSSEIQAYMAELPPTLSQTRRDLIEFALQSVGKVPYYWGGKASGPDYEPNGFGTIISPDYKGRILKGLDCSGWINWIYWSVTGNRLPYESTAGLAACGTPISRSELQPGDIVLHTGTDAHVIMFLGWTADGKIQCIHESSGPVNNVCVSVRDANWPYYRRLVE